MPYLSIVCKFKIFPEEKEKTAKEGFFQIPKLPVAKETLIQKPSYETSYDLNNIKKTTGLESSSKFCSKIASEDDNHFDLQHWN